MEPWKQWYVQKNGYMLLLYNSGQIVLLLRPNENSCTADIYEVMDKLISDDFVIGVDE